MIRSPAVAGLLLLASCVSPSRKIVSGPAAAPADALAAGVTAGPAFGTLGVNEADAGRALSGFRASCPALLRRTDRSRLTRPADWQPACSAAATATDALRFFTDAFETVRVGAGASFTTGYYEPEIAASRMPVADGTPVYALPSDLVERAGIACPATPPCPSVTQRGRIVDDAFVPYFDRASIEEGALAGRGLELAWAIDPIDFFFLQVQGSGRLRFADGSVMRIGYAGQNGYSYTGIGKLMKDRGLLEGRPTSMQGIVAWLREHPAEGRAIMRENKSWIFFRELTSAGPLGALNVPVVTRVSVAADPAFVPLGAPVFLSMDRADATGLWIAQDTGGAIKGANRFDTFWGAGDEAARIAGGMSARGTAFVLLPKGTSARMMADGGAAARP